RHRPVRIKSCGFFFFFLGQKKEVYPDNAEQHGDAGTNVRTDRRFFFAGDSAATHRIVMKVIESAINGVRQDGIGLMLKFGNPDGAMSSRYRSCPPELRVIG